MTVLKSIKHGKNIVYPAFYEIKSITVYVKKFLIYWNPEYNSSWKCFKISVYKAYNLASLQSTS